MGWVANYEIEGDLIDAGYLSIAGVDEVGRGCGMGPVVASAVVIPPNVVPVLMGKVRDSKKLSAKRREEYYSLIAKHCIYAFAGVDNKIIDEINILNATKLAMARAVKKLIKKVEVDYVLVDGTSFIDVGNIPQQQIIDGDYLSLSIAAASIVAKVLRDNIVISLHDIYPQYGWKNNKGYLTKEHIDALKKYGPTEFHRLSFNKVGF